MIPWRFCSTGRGQILLSALFSSPPYLPLVPHICVSESGQHWFKWWLVAYSAPSHYLNQYCIIVNWTLRRQLQWNTKIFIHENAYQNNVCEMVAIFSRGDDLNRWLFCYQRKPPWVNTFRMPLSVLLNRGKEFEFDMDTHKQLKSPVTKTAAITVNTQMLVWVNKETNAPITTLRIMNLFNHSTNTTKAVIKVAPNHKT